MTKLSAFVTTFNNARTLAACLESIKWADEILVLDSFSSDATLGIARQYGAVVVQHAFLGYGPQKQLALEQTSHRWVLLLDADEALSPELQDEIRRLLEKGPNHAGYELPRQEQMFWRMASTSARLNGFLRLFDKTRGRVTSMAVHAAPEVEGPVGRLKAPFYHYGETDIHTKVEKVNSYSSGLVSDKLAKKKSPNPWKMVFYPPFFFLRLYLFKRNFLNGWAGFIASAVSSFYAFLKYAKLYEHRQQERFGTSLLPVGAPDPEPRSTPK